MLLRETIDFTGAEFIEEGGARIVKNVVMLGEVSSHGYTYRQAAMKRAVESGLYEGARCFVNHSQGSRDVRDLAGGFVNTRHEGGKVKGDAHLLNTEPGRIFWEVAKSKLPIASCSHVADGKLVKGDDGKQYVEEISRVDSVDLVVQGATTRSVFEADDPANPPTVGDSSIPTPKAHEKKFQYIARCLRSVKDANSTITDTEAGAMCFASWDSRYESAGGVPSGSGDDVMPGEPEPPGMEGDHDEPAEDPLAKKLAAFDTLLEQGRRLLPFDPSTGRSNHFSERNHDMTLEQTLDARERSIEEIARLADPRHEDIVRAHQRQEDDHVYAQRCEDARRRDEGRAQKIAEESAARGRESDSQFEQRLRERRLAREECERLAPQVAEQAVAGIAKGEFSEQR